ncbi:MAG: TonB family protein [Cyanobacteria bacterium J06621_8]
MTNSQFCVQQRQQQNDQLNKILIAGFTCSALVHGILAYALPRWSFETTPIAEEPIELTLIEKPKPEPEPKVESKPIVEPEIKPLAQPKPVRAKTTPTPAQQPEPVKAQKAPPKPLPKKVLTASSPTASQTIVAAPLANQPQGQSISSSATVPTSAIPPSTAGSNPGGGTPGSAVAANSAPPRPQATVKQMRCTSNCQPEYPAVLQGQEGNAVVKLTINPDGRVVGAKLIKPHSNTTLNRQALLAAQRMRFSSPVNVTATVRVNIDFTVEGSEYDRLAREEKARQRQAARESQENEEKAARQRQLEAERQARRERLEEQRKTRQKQLQQQPPAVESRVASPVEPKALPQSSSAPTPVDLDAERLRKFRERLKQYR